MKNVIGQDLGRYHIIEPLGQGGMASVFKAFDTTLERYVAVKIIRTDINDGDDKAFLLRFQREAKALAQLDHPYILKVLDYGEHDSIPYLVMPFVPGGTLKQKMGHPMPYQEAATLLAPIARALEYAHEQKIIHRDVKPANILITQVGAPLLSDFGIAKMLTSGDTAQLTATGVGIGTPDYMAPEQWLGRAEPRTDIYSLGVVYYEMITGHRPFSADTPAAVLLKHLNDPLPRPKIIIPDLPDPIEQVLFKALAKEPESRFQNMGEFALALEKIAHSEPTSLETVMAGFDTVFNPVTASPKPAETIQKTAIAATAVAQQPSKSSNTGKIALIVAAVILVLGLFCLLIGGGIWASVASKNNSRQITPEATQAGQTSSKPASGAETPQVQFPGLGGPQNSADEKPTPFTSIEGLPEDVPLVTENNGDLSTTTSQGTKIYTFTTHVSCANVSDFYQSEMKKNGWEVLSETTQQGMVQRSYMKGESRIVMLGMNDEGDNCRVMIMLVAQE